MPAIDAANLRLYLFTDPTAWPFAEPTPQDRANQTPAYVIHAARARVAEAMEQFAEAVRRAEADQRLSDLGRRERITTAAAELRARLATLAPGSEPSDGLTRALAALRVRLGQAGAAPSLDGIAAPIASALAAHLLAMTPAERGRLIEHAATIGDRATLAVALSLPPALGLGPDERAAAAEALDPEGAAETRAIGERLAALDELLREASGAVDRVSPPRRVRPSEAAASAA